MSDNRWCQYQILTIAASDNFSGCVPLHIALTLLAFLFMLQQRVAHQEDMPLLSCQDIRWILAHTVVKKANTVQDILELIKERHQRRQYDIDRCLRKQQMEAQEKLTHGNMTK